MPYQEVNLGMGQLLSQCREVGCVEKHIAERAYLNQQEPLNRF
jgi:hypothetical protein